MSTGSAAGGLMERIPKQNSSGQRRPAVMNGAKIPYLYITGASYSGSTLLSFLLNAHPQMVTVSTMALGRSRHAQYRCSCGETIVECPFFVELEQRVKALGSTSFSMLDTHVDYRLSEHRWLDAFLTRPLRNVPLERVRDALVPLWPGYRQGIEFINQHNLHYAQAALEVSGKEVFVDASKDSMRVKFLRDIDQFDLRVIHLVRDARGGTASNVQRGKGDVPRSARIWYTANMNADRASRYVSPDRWLRLRYDDMCNDTQGTMDRISDFMGVERVPVPRDFYECEHHILGNPMRMKGIGVVRKSETWKKQLTDSDLKVIARIGGAANRYFGHEWP